MRLNKEVTIDLVSGVEGYSLYVDDFRIAGAKPWGGGKTIRTWKAKVENILAALRIDPEELRPKGEWKYYHKRDKAVCTNCSFERDLDADFGKAVSCPNCGAKMEGEKK